MILLKYTGIYQTYLNTINLKIPTTVSLPPKLIQTKIKVDHICNVGISTYLYIRDDFIFFNT